MSIDLSQLDHTELEALRKDIDKEIENRRVQQEAELRERIKQEAQRMGLTIEQLVSLLKGRSPAARGETANRRRSPVPKKYFHPEDPSLAWSGRGRKPRWVEDLLAEGYNLSDLEQNPYESQEGHREAG